MTTTYRSASSAETVDDATLTTEIEAARTHLAAAIEAKGEDYVYSAPEGFSECLYLEYEEIKPDETFGVTLFGPKCPSCIVGHVLVGMGFSFDQITEREGDNAKTAIEALGAFTSTIVTEALYAAQQQQDHANGYTWGQAVEVFEDYIEAYTIKVERADD